MSSRTWQFSEALQEYYYFDTTRNLLVTESGSLFRQLADGRIVRVVTQPAAVPQAGSQPARDQQPRTGPILTAAGPSTPSGYNTSAAQPAAPSSRATSTNAPADTRGLSRLAADASRTSGQPRPSGLGARVLATSPGGDVRPARTAVSQPVTQVASLSRGGPTPGGAAYPPVSQASDATGMTQNQLRGYQEHSSLATSRAGASRPRERQTSDESSSHSETEVAARSADSVDSTTRNYRERFSQLYNNLLQRDVPAPSAERIARQKLSQEIAELQRRSQGPSAQPNAVSNVTDQLRSLSVAQQTPLTQPNVQPSARPASGRQPYVESNRQPFVQPTGAPSSSRQPNVQPGAVSFSSQQTVVQPGSAPSSSRPPHVQPGAPPLTSRQVNVQSGAGSVSSRPPLVQPDSTPSSSRQYNVQPGVAPSSSRQSNVPPGSVQPPSRQLNAAPRPQTQTQASTSTQAPTAGSSFNTIMEDLLSRGYTREDALQIAHQRIRERERPRARAD